MYPFALIDLNGSTIIVCGSLVIWYGQNWIESFSELDLSATL